MPGWGGKVLRVDLTGGKIKQEKVGKDLLRKYIGGVGLGSYYLLNEIREDIDPLSPANKIMIFTGPLTGTGIPSSGRFCIVTKSPLTGCFLQSHSGGHFGPEVRYASLDGIIIEGKAENPVYLYVEDDYVEIKNASRIWGKGIKETTRILENEVDGEARILAIGPAGENRVLISSVQNDVYRACARGGGGAVFGSKNLKAVVVRGTSAVEVNDGKRLKEIVLENIAKSKEKLSEFTKFGTTNTVLITNKSNILPTKNFAKSSFEFAEDISGHQLQKEIWKGRRACFSCSIACSQFSASGSTRTEGPEYETIFSLGANLLNSDADIIVKANELCNDMGIDTISAGVAIGWLMEASEKGIIKEKVSWGDKKSILDLISEIAAKEGMGVFLSEGVNRASDKLGGNSFAIHVKGLELPGYDPRGSQGMALAYATSTRGGCHLRAPMYVKEIFTDKFPAKTLEGKVGPLIEMENTFAVIDSLIMCGFASRMLFGNSFKNFSELLKTVTGHNFLPEEMALTGERIWTTQKLFNLCQGITAEKDTLPKRFFTEDANGVVLDEDEFSNKIREYYRARGWDESGKPLKETLKRLSIEGECILS
ncbi:MAG: aldehyde ferredoxin oxidoreductase family protein [Candidatus Methanofastidiosia archaeon]